MIIFNLLIATFNVERNKVKYTNWVPINTKLILFQYLYIVMCVHT